MATVAVRPPIPEFPQGPLSQDPVYLSPSHSAGTVHRPQTDRRRKSVGTGQEQDSLQDCEQSRPIKKHDTLEDTLRWRDKEAVPSLLPS